MPQLQGKSTQKTPVAVTEDFIEIPSELIAQHKNITLAIDVMFINKVQLLTSIDTTLKYHSCIVIKDRTAEQLYQGIRKILQIYNKASFVVKTIKCDGEFENLLTNVEQDFDVTLALTARDEHVPEAERNNRTIKEIFRGEFSRLPFKMMPKLMIQYLALRSTFILNIYPAKGGVSDHFSPHMLLQCEKLHFNHVKNCVKIM